MDFNDGAADRLVRKNVFVIVWQCIWKGTCLKHDAYLFNILAFSCIFTTVHESTLPLYYVASITRWNVSKGAPPSCLCKSRRAENLPGASFPARTFAIRILFRSKPTCWSSRKAISFRSYFALIVYHAAFESTAHFLQTNLNPMASLWEYVHK